MIICGAGLAPGEHGTPAVVVERNAFCKECGNRHDFEKCPDCGSWITPGFGLMFGGYGDFKMCNNECGWWWMNALGPDEE